MKELWSIHKIKILAATFGLALLSFIGWSNMNGDKTDSSIEQISFAETIQGEETEETTSEEIENHQEEAVSNQEVLIDIKGQVQQPGVYRMKTGDRIIDAVEKAGGFMEGADSNKVNLAALLADEMVIIVPKEGEEVDEVIQQPEITGKNESASAGGLVNINTASEEELTTLTGVGPAKAKAIIEYRMENGLFKKVEDIMQVTGIGEKSFEKLRNQITVAN